MIFADDFVERRNIAWRGEPGRKDSANPIMTPRYPWDSGEVFSHGCVLIDPTDGLYKAWYLSTPRGTKDRQCTYAVSEDGVNWQRPQLDVYPCDGYDKTNIILGSKMGGKLGQLSVIIHPDAEPDRRYEMFCFRDPCHWVWKTPGYGCPDKRIEGVPLPPGYDHHLYGMYRHYSADGIHWRPQPEPVAGNARTSAAYGGRPVVSADGMSIFQIRDGRYVMHNKVELQAIPGGYVPHDIGVGCCRTIARRESDDGQRWSETYQNVLTPDWRDPSDTQFMELGCNQYNDGFVGMATVYHCHEGTIDLQLAGSPDGVKWFRPVRRPAVAPQPLGDYGSGMLWPMRGFVIDGDQVHIYYAGTRGLHGDLYATQRNVVMFEAAWCRATWDIGRMWAVLHVSGNDQQAHVATRPLACGGKTLTINALVRPGGKVEAELVDEQLKPIDGYTRGDCIPLEGDHRCAPVRWRSHPIADVPAAGVRIILTDALLYGFDWR